MTGMAAEQGPQTGGTHEEYDPPQIVAKALLCFNNKYVSKTSLIHHHNTYTLWSFSRYCLVWFHLDKNHRFTVAVKNPIDWMRAETSTWVLNIPMNTALERAWLKQTLSWAALTTSSPTFCFITRPQYRISEIQSRQHVGMAQKEVLVAVLGCRLRHLWSLFWLLSSIVIWRLNLDIVGNFNVAEHIQAEASNAQKAINQIVFGLGLMVLWRGLLP